MSDQDPKPAHADYLRRYVESLEALEVLLALSRHPGAATISGICAIVSMSDGQVQEALKHLVASGAVVASDDRHHWEVSGNPEVSNGLRELDSAYRSNRYDVIAELASQSIERARMATLRAFARAFVLRKKNDG